MTYTPPFTISAKAINLIAEIAAQIERYAIRMEQGDALIKDVGVNEGKILALIHLNNRISAKMLAEQLVLSTRQVERLITGLKKKGYLVRMGSAKGGYWIVNR
nr:HTH domain-containing protein [Parabacteroides acidifaciens]